MKRLGIGVGIGFATLMSGLVTAFACTSAASITSVSPNAGPPGSHVTANYSGGNPNGTSNVYFGGQAHGVMVASVPTSGSFSVTFAVPQNAAPGNYLVEVVANGVNGHTGAKSREVARAIYQVTPAVGAAASGVGTVAAGQQVLVPQPVTQGDQVHTVIINEGVTRGGASQGQSTAFSAQPQQPLAPGQAVNLASQGVGSAMGLILVLLGVAVLGTSVVAAGAVALGRVLQPERESQKQKI